MSLITLTTDFGTRDWFMGTMKGVILTLHPHAQIVDITHDIPPGDIRAGAFALKAACQYFPTKTVHVVVVDPGVGSQRGALAVQTQRYTFIGPDNGVLAWALAGEKIKSIRLIANDDLFLKPVSRTFHGRDIFSPVAAYISRGLPFSRVGPEIGDWVQLPWPAVKKQRGGLEGEIVYIDRFGNAITNLTAAAISALNANSVSLFFKGKRLCPLVEFYQAVPTGHPAAIVGSSEFLEIAVNGGSAARKYALKTGRKVTVKAR